MPRRGQHDQSPGDARKPFSDRGGPEARHAETHDVRREQATNPKGTAPADDVAELATVAPAGAPGGHAGESVAAADDKDLHGGVQDLDGRELARLTVLIAGARLEQGGTYVDLNDLAAGPFKALGGQEAGRDNRYVAKRDTDHELWNRLVGQGRAADVERPTRAAD